MTVRMKKKVISSFYLKYRMYVFLEQYSHFVTRTVSTNPFEIIYKNVSKENLKRLESYNVVG